VFYIKRRLFSKSLLLFSGNQRGEFMSKNNNLGERAKKKNRMIYLGCSIREKLLEALFNPR
jgi:hypothetical protein